MGWFDGNRDAHQQIYGDQQHEAKFSHELIGGAAAFEAMKSFENSQRRKGETVSHGTAKELLAAVAGAEVDRLFETKGLDAYDREEAKRHAKRQAEQMYDDHYGGQGEYDPNSRDRPPLDY
ncbi:hypothetical protein PFICI_09153 [Pestalotiopsis fici W106-1]|uniref:CipC-like antibiotic response protein n=1 Tax=Pestalotiopsis fici (strain W106-1 / CGMCC3.15140) TaxID=1229662 RepID=W3WZN0_PESFW|nr:uncharacterized protein PFICI_09153 [Pestalotiopsis fici W106-1]ETS79300.1 hypothetical protein PFICI_09153 [Pestalotiopsis fici W106-1]